MKQEIPFDKGESDKHVVKVGKTVRKDTGSNSDRVHSVLKFLTSKGFTLTPIFLGVDEKGREIITYIAGEPINTDDESIELSKQCMKGLRRFHDILSNSDLRGTEETVCHRDFAPWNILSSKGKIVGIVDLDDVCPGKRITDVAYACWTFLNLGDSKIKRSTQEQIQQIVILLDAYGPIDTSDFIDELLSEQTRVLQYRKSRVSTARNEEERKLRQEKSEEIVKQIEWVKKNREEIDCGLSKLGQSK